MARHVNGYLKAQMLIIHYIYNLNVKQSFINSMPFFNAINRRLIYGEIRNSFSHFHHFEGL